MNELVSAHTSLPDTIEDLSKFVLINEERVQALRAQIRAIKKVNVAKEVYEQKLAEAQEIGEMTVEAAQKMGELLLQIQKATPNNNKFHENRDTSNLVKTKTEITSEMGMSKDQVSQYQQMAQNPEAVQAAIQKAIDNGDVVSRSQVMKEIKAVKEEAQKEIEKLKNQKPKEVVPADYIEAKNKARSYDAETRRLNNKLQDLYAERNELQEQIKELQERTAGENLRTRVMEGALFFIAGCGGFVRDYGGYIWITEHLEELDETDRRNYEWAVRNVYAWAEKFIEALNVGKAKMLEVDDE